MEEWSGEAPIHMAMSLDTSARALPVVRCLRAHGASINAATDDERRLPIHCAAAAGLLEVVRYLVDEGADILPKDDNDADGAVDGVREWTPGSGTALARQRRPSQHAQQ